MEQLRRVALIAVSILGLVVLVLAVVWLLTRGDAVVTTGDSPTVEIVGLDIPIASPQPILTAPNQFLGVPAEAPQFDITALGDDWSFTQTEDDLLPLDPDEVLRAVYLGNDVAGNPYYIWQSGSEDFWQLVGQIIADFGSFGRFETSYGTEETGDFTGREFGFTSGSIMSSSNSPTTLTAEWHALPSTVSIVVFYDGDDAIGWQRPVSGTVAVRHAFESDGEATSANIVMVALDQAGNELRSHALFGPPG